MREWRTKHCTIRTDNLSELIFSFPLPSISPLRLTAQPPILGSPAQFCLSICRLYPPDISYNTPLDPSPIHQTTHLTRNGITTTSILLNLVCFFSHLRRAYLISQSGGNEPGWKAGLRAPPKDLRPQTEVFTLPLRLLLPLMVVRLLGCNSH
jgi:hypothetical protein